MKIFNNGYIFTQEDEVFYCERDKLYLPDRFIIGKCPHCGYEAARGDQCEKCGSLLTPKELIEPRCAVCGQRPVIKKVRHYYFDLPKFTHKLKEFIINSSTLSENAKNFSIKMLEMGLKPRAITRNNKWGISAPFPGAEDLTIYVWFEAVLGYISAVIEYFEKRGERDKWKEWWWNPDTNVAFFIGKDNIPFHTIIFPALLMATGDPYTLRFYIGATEYLNFEGKKFSKTHKIGIWCDEAIKLLPADYWRYVLINIRPETRDSSFTWDIMEKIINEDLNNNIGNLIHRVITLIVKYLNGVVSKCNPMTKAQSDLINLISNIASNTKKLYYEMKFQKIPNEVQKIAKSANALINKERPWETIRTAPDLARSTIYTSLRAIIAIMTILYPIIPESSMKFFRYIGLDKNIEWSLIFKELDKIEVSKDYKPLFRRISKEELIKKLNEIRGEEELIDASYLSKIDIRVGLIEQAELKEGTEKIIRLIVNIGDRKLKILAGLGDYYKPDDLIGKRVIVITNIKPKKIIDEYSEAMILAADDGRRIKILTVDGFVKEGARVY